MEAEAVAVLSEEVEAGEGLLWPLVGVETGANLKPELGHTLEATE